MQKFKYALKNTLEVFGTIFFIFLIISIFNSQSISAINSDTSIFLLFFFVAVFMGYYFKK